MPNRWTEQEDHVLKRCFPHMRDTELAEYLPGRSHNSVRWRASYLGLYKSPEHRTEVSRDNKSLSGPPPNKKEPISRVCETCHGTFYVRPYRHKARFCSIGCHNEHKRTIRGESHWLYSLVESVCEWCGETFKTKPAKLKYGEGRFCSRACLGSYTMSKQGGRRSSIEIAIEKVLDAIDEPYDSQKRIGKYLVDFYLPRFNLILECDGDYWHNLPDVKRRDARKDKWFRDHDYQVLRLSESEINAGALDSLTDGLTGQNLALFN